MILALALLTLALAALPACLAAINLSILRTPEPEPEAPGLVSILIPARNEAGVIEGTVRAALASAGIAIEVLVGDDHSTDDTATIVRRIAEADPRLRLVAVPDLPEGWTGKNHACAMLAREARGDLLLFLDADVTLAPNGVAGLAAHARRANVDLVSGVPRQLMDSLGERLTVPMIDFLLIGYLPMALMRLSPDPSLGAACGQMILMRADAYRASGGHAAIRTSLHDGVRLPRLFRGQGLRTDLVAGHALATCRMYRDWPQSWAGFSKNAREGMATPRALPIWTVLLFGGHVLPWLVLVSALLASDSSASWIAAGAALLSLATRAAITLVVREPAATVPLHPLTVCTALAIQWNALLRPARAGVAVWKGRRYPITALPPVP
ncbi:cellulose synthase/poly-beta-1,6-N-acetylglucosamine synthase-like glycosyltransferase [Methylorubrum rhodinum]|uniref:Cellulose synthase/poly-beta-1,6-N-acetylglucosamine synthase-like glycosyltransferase n=1 Tax=Methylorubrum rhodinum TaxID=29428 RepID=A0A840ZJW7_9HYPH|nr:glycosyltransferase family 2 protein [Methylorubrum rhodinum]MBB5757385.1 cellulose synthase/poly-beta-1,6-N-acetylglucosamine synthase-like glycosyltransferase [Methylorubrum rhodinum]